MWNMGTKIQWNDTATQKEGKGGEVGFPHVKVLN